MQSSPLYQTFSRVECTHFCNTAAQLPLLTARQNLSLAAAAAAAYPRTCEKLLFFCKEEKEELELLLLARQEEELAVGA